MADTGQERTESATPRRRAKAREKGQVARSTEVSSVVVLAVGLAALAMLGPDMTNKAASYVREIFRGVGTVSLDATSIIPFFKHGGLVLFSIVIPMAGLIAAAGVAANLAQTGILLTLQPLAPQFNRINPTTGLKRIFSKRGAMELFKSLVKMSVVAGVVAWTLLSTVESFTPLMTVETFGAYRVIFTAMIKMAAAAAFALAIVAILDFFFQRYEFEEQNKMTKQQVKEEHKENEGDPQIKGKVRALQQALSRQRMMQDVKEADVVVTNPIRFAVALKYDVAKGGAPRVVAKGARLMAKRIREIAREAGVPIIENPPLARSLFKACRVGAEVPLSLYKAVAELLAFVFRQRDQAAAGGAR
ncbi:MAG: flagellar biosynthesis protein FlhB [Gemmatimonadota bacterium]|nr:MAG: flagellar biosynthesis protein FlhB [Gemmatimonadota bacterium]